MRFLSFMIALGALLPVAPALLRKRVINDPADLYVTQMCLPLFSNGTRSLDLHLTLGDKISSLANSPFPCEQRLYIEAVCMANGTTQIDFLAEQECLCNGAFFDVLAGCNACYAAHGYPGVLPAGSPQESLMIATLSAQECEPSPPFQPFSNLVPAANITSLSELPPVTLGDDRFPNNTAVSNYWTPTRSITPGEITGSATARATSWKTSTNVLYTPTSIPPNSGITSTPSISSSISPSSRSSTAASSSATASGNVAAGIEVRAAGGLFAAVLCLAVLL